MSRKNVEVAPYMYNAPDQDLPFWSERMLPPRSPTQAEDPTLAAWDAQGAHQRTTRAARETNTDWSKEPMSPQHNVRLIERNDRTEALEIAGAGMTSSTYPHPNEAGAAAERLAVKPG